MRLHRLRMNAFGPFPGTEHIDFDALSEAGLFLLRGETGAGKTSVLDAVCFALYGTLPGVRGGTEKGVRSHYAEPDAIPEVELEFAVRERRFRITRTPEWQRPKKRGTGFTRAQSSVALAERVGGGWTPLSTRPDEVGQQIGAVLGMDVHQFTRVAMLPQGEFAAFLRSGDGDRERLLRRLFDTELFDATTEAAAARHRELAERLGKGGDRRDALAEDADRHARARLGEQAVDAALGPATVPDAAGPGSAVSSSGAGALPQTADAPEASETPRLGDPAWFDAVEAVARDRSASAEAERIRAASGVEAARVAHVEGQRAAADAAALAEWRTRTAAFEAGVDAALADAARWERHTVAQSVRSEIDAAASAAVRAASANEALRGAAATLRAVPERTIEAEGGSASAWYALAARLLAGADDAPGAELASWRGLVDGAAEAAAEALRLEAAADAAGKASTLAAEEEGRAEERARVAARAASSAESAHAAAVERLAGLPEDTGAVERTLLAVRTAADRLAAATAATVARAAHEGAAAREALTALGRNAASDAAYALRTRREAAMAGILAAALVPGKACLVCGSAEHPDPHSQEGLDEVSTEAIEAADASVRRAEEAHTAARGEEQRTRAELSAALSASDGLSEEDATAALEAASLTAEEAKGAAEARAAAVRAVEKAEQTLGAATVAARDAAEEAARRASLAAEASEAAAEAAARAEGAGAGHPGVAARRAALREWSRALDSAVSALGAAAAASGEQEAATAARDAALSDAGMGLEEARAAVLPAVEADAVRARVQARAREKARLDEAASSDAVTRARLAEQAGREVPDAAALEAMAAALAEAEALHGERSAAATLATQLVSDLADRRFTIAGLDAELGPLHRKVQVARTVAELTRGDGENRLRMSLTTYVLAARLEAVAEAASLRLDSMSDGRYRLVHIDERHGRGRSGLGLAVEDAWTGSRRAPETLSGGETFMASLALALGLADVVQEESGGVDIDTLFIDEGFGTLDPETLELVLDGLDQLRRGGRLIGVVSHVAELGQRISAQIRVDKSRNGSTLRLEGLAVRPPAR